MTQLNAYLNFNGNCREVMTFYQACLGGELNLQTIADAPFASQMPAEAQQNILHATLTKGSLLLMGSDMLGADLKTGNNVTLSINCSSEDEIRRFFANLSVEGQVRDPLAMMFWGAMFGALTDKFGQNWLLNYDKNQPA